MRASFILDLQTAELVLLRTDSEGDVIEEMDDCQRNAAADAGAQQSACLLVVASERVEDYGAGERERDSRWSYGADEHVLKGNQRLVPWQFASGRSGQARAG